MSHSLYVSRLILTDFRNHAALDLELDPRPICLFGPNGAGKTNILEGLTMLAPGRGLRSASLTDVARAGEGDEFRAQPWAVSARIRQDGEETVLGAGAERTPEGGVKRITRRGPGLMFEFRNHHISNAGTRGENLGVNAAMMVVGVHWVLRTAPHR